jgi:formylglycine-generating enzyme required for sulfatase activity
VNNQPSTVFKSEYRKFSVLINLACLNFAFQAAATAQANPSAKDHEALLNSAAPELPTFAEKVAKATGITLVRISPGSFLMGSPHAASNGYTSDEQPQTKVALTEAYWLGATDVTQAQYESLMGNNPSSFKGPDLPVETVTWFEAIEFCQKLTKREQAEGRLPKGYAYSLPTEAQWEYACRAGTTGAWYGKLDGIAWFSANSDGTTHPVGEKKPNAWGLYDMVGNVSQWCLDWLGRYPGGNAIDPPGPSSGSVHVKRGGSWGEDAYYCRSAFRGGDNPDTLGHPEVGFRLALTPAR